MTKFAVIGAGGWGTAMAILLAQRSHEVTLLGHDDAHVSAFCTSRTNLPFLPGCRVPEEVLITTDAKRALEGAEHVLSVVPSSYLRKTWEKLAELVPEGASITSLTKGIENGTSKRPTEIIAEYAAGHDLAVLSGPSHAEEAARFMPTTVTIAAKKSRLARRLQSEMGTESLRVYTNADVIGVELGGAMKNVIALAAGIVDGLGFGDNTKAALLTRGLSEIITFGHALGAKVKTFHGLAGIGDLITTAFSPHGRNRAVGERIGRGEKLDEILASTPKVAEGVPTTRSAHDLAKKLGIEMPITTEVYRVLFKNKDPRRAVTELMTRQGKDE
ncbi:MAG: NAD(P)-dependent glycerol-3-phosphate dehydrogenase [Planctomycetes bacterium]|nr:NAD(P)-dependent glycerol-3-phosphate dehydrogenase [Planctomycetota bacterium]